MNNCLRKYCYLGDVPYYSQEASDYCWAACLQMICAAVKSSESFAKIPGIIGALGIDQAGLSTIVARFSSTIRRLIYQRTMMQLDCRLWLPAFSTNRIIGYIREQLTDTGSPVMIVSAPKGHSWVIIGYDGDDFIVHDPGSSGRDALCSTKVAPEALGLNWALPLVDSYCTLVIPLPMDERRPVLTTQIGNEDIRFIIPGFGTKDGKSDMIWYSWICSAKKGYHLFSQREQQSVEVLPAFTTTLKSDHGLPVYNSTEKEKSATVIVRLESESSHEVYSEEQLQLKVPARGCAKIPVLIDLACTRYNEYNDFYVPREFRFLIEVSDTEGRSDQAFFYFKMLG